MKKNSRAMHCNLCILYYKFVIQAYYNLCLELEKCTRGCFSLRLQKSNILWNKTSKSSTTSICLTHSQLCAHSSIARSKETCARTQGEKEIRNLCTALKIKLAELTLFFERRNGLSALLIKCG